MYKVLIADDEPLILAGLRKKISWGSLGFEIVGECTDGKTLLDELVSKNPDLLVLDIQMPHMTGLQVLRAIRDISNIPSIVISGFSDFSYAQEALRYGVIDYLLKPVSSSMLQSAVLKAKQHLDLNTVNGRRDAGLMFQFLKLNIDKISDSALLSRLALSGSRRYYWVAAFHSSCAIKHRNDVEIAMLRYDEEIVIALVHCNDMPADYEEFLKSHFSFNGNAGVCKPFKNIGELAQAAEEAVLAYETAWFRPGIYLWPTETEEQSIKFFLRELERAGQNSSLISGMLGTLPTYLLEHRLTAKSAEVIYNTLITKAQNRMQEQPVCYRTWKELKAQYQTADYLLLELHRILAPGADNDGFTTSRAIVFKIKAILQKDYQQPLSLQSMASRFHIDNSYLSSLFHEETGKTFTNYLTEIRVQHACKYLKTTNLTNGKIAQLCGFSSDSYMKKVFRKVLGITPSAYRAGAQPDGKNKGHTI
ncbi:MAG: response regulator [Clostridiales bacterium]|nr:response regulator [Clostridiales bacterium]MDY4008906.1 response regulator [Candidatus Limiplasma sp.]